FRDKFNQGQTTYNLPVTTSPLVKVSVIMPGAVWQIVLSSSDPNSPPTTFVVSKGNATRMDIAIGIQLNTSREVGLHPQLVSYDMNKSNGVNVGLNPVVTVKPGETKTVNWYAGTIEADGSSVRYAPVEFGSVNLTPSDPLRQHPYGMIGALIVEPEGSTWQTDVNSRASAMVTKADKQQFREFVSMLQDDVTGISFFTPPSGGGSVTISGDIFNGKPTWIMNGQPLPSSGVKLSSGQTVTFNIKAGTHGILFNNESQARAVFDIAGSPDAGKFKVLPNQCSIATPFGTSPQPSGTIATITVKQPVTLTSLPFICSQHCQNMPGSFAISSGGGGKTVAITGDVVNGKPTWVMGGKALPPTGVSLNPGDTVTFDIKTGKHGLLFDDEASAQAVFDIAGSPDAGKFKVLPNQCNIATAFGTEPQPSGHIATITVKQKVTLTSLPFLCSQHCQAMTGLFTLGTTTPVTGGPPLAVNYRSEWVNYRYSGQNLPFGASPLGIARALSNTIVSADPQTPIFAASAGMPIRFRNLHPAGINEQIWTLHGHGWQEEPYVDGSTRIGNNPLSQVFGSRDAFVANSSFDAVIDKAGGAAGTVGDYLYRTFVQVDFQDGIWGILRVGEPGKDIVTITKFAPQTSGGPATLTGTNTVNPSTGQMADSVTVADASTGTVIGTFPVDKMTGAWPAGGTAITIPASVTSIRVTSSLGGVAVAPTYTQQVGIPSTPAPTAPPDDEVFKFRQRPNAAPGSPKK
ncbi:MAG TPA: hypothetical protein VFV34_23075, partial [Blastocatellia bacterium]|nr:hypothetical protein [Blastocatellia bacterium]